MSTLQLALKNQATYLADYSDRTHDSVIAWNQHGVEKIAYTAVIPTDEAFITFNQAGPLTVEANIGGLTIGDARLENPKLTQQGLELEALGYWVALGDVPYTTLWSDTSTKNWESVPDTIAGYQDKRYSFDTNNRLYIAPTKGAAQVNNQAGGLTYAMPDKGRRTITGVSFDYQFIAPTNWIAVLDTDAINLWSINSSGLLQSGTLHIVPGTPANNLIVYIYYNSATAATYSGETGAAYLKITNLRVVTSIANRITTTLTAARAAGTSVAATVGSTARMYIGQQLQVQSGTNGETVTVQSITNATTFVATFVRTHPSGSAVQAHIVQTDEIARDIISAVIADNPTQLSSDVGAIQPTGDDLTDIRYEDVYPDSILDTLAGNIGWAVGVDTARRLYLRPRTGRAWYVDATDLQVQRSLNALRNDAYAVFTDASGSTLRTANNPQRSRYAITRRTVVAAQTTSSVLAARQRDISLLNTRDVLPQAQFPFDAIYDERGAAWPLWAMRPDDTITVRNLPPSISTDVNRVTTFRITRVEWHPDDDTVVVEPEAPLPILEALL